VVEVFEPLKSPTSIELKNASPSKEATVIEYTGNHFNGFIANSSSMFGRTRPAVGLVWGPGLSEVLG